MTELDHAWAAGFMDGEGCISIAKRGKYFALTISVGQKYRAPLLRLQNLYGGSLCQCSQGYWRYNLQCREAAAMLRKIVPHLSLKEEQARIGIAFQERKSKAPRGCHARPSDVDAGDYELMRRLKVPVI